MYYPHSNDRTMTNFSDNISYVLQARMRDVYDLPLTKELFDKGYEWRDAIEPIRKALPPEAFH